MRWPSLLLLITVCVVGLLWVGCGSEQDTPGTQPAVVIIPTRWASANASNLDRLLKTNPVAFIGTVISSSQREAEKPLQSTRQSFPLTHFEVLVEESLTPDIVPGSHVTVQQPGGILTRQDGSSAVAVLDGDKLMTLGSTYQFFANRSTNDSDVFVTSPFARLELSRDGKFVPLLGWENLGAMQSLSGLTVRESGQLIGSVAEP